MPVRELPAIFSAMHDVRFDLRPIWEQGSRDGKFGRPSLFAWSSSSLPRHILVLASEIRNLIRRKSEHVLIFTVRQHQANMFAIQNERIRLNILRRRINGN